MTRMNIEKNFFFFFKRRKSGGAASVGSVSWGTVNVPGVQGKTVFWGHSRGWGTSAVLQ